MVELTGSPEKVVTIADMDAGKHGVRFTSGGDGRNVATLQEAALLAEQGTLQLPIAKTYGLDEVADAQRESEEGHPRGKLVIVL